jgi:hypothetical protein
MPLNDAKEVVPVPERFLGFGGWVHPGVLGGIPHKDEVWTVFGGVDPDRAPSYKKGEPWEYRLILLREEQTEGLVALAVDRIVGLVPLDLNKIQKGQVQLFEVTAWSNKREVTQISISQEL